MSIESYLSAGRACVQRGDFAGALAQADAALEEAADSFDALQLRGRALFLLGRDDEALATLRQAQVALHREASLEDDRIEDEDPFTQEPELEPEPVNMEALETLLALRARYHLDVDLLALLAELAEDAWQYDTARETYEELIEREPNRLDAWEGLVHVLCHTNLDAAQEVVERALELFPAHTLFYEFLGFIHYRRRRFRSALAAYRQAIDFGAAHADNYEALVQCYLALGELDRALDMLEIHAARDPNDPEMHRFAVEAALGSGQAELALQHAHQLVRLEPAHAETYCYKAWVEVALGDWDSAERTLRLGFHKANDGAFALFELVNIFLTDGALNEALRVAELAQALAPLHPEASVARGKVLKEMGAPAEALAAFRHAVQLAPQDDVYQVWLGVALAADGDYEAALRQFQQVLTRHPDDLWALGQRGLTYLAMDVPERAYADFTRGQEIDPEDAHLYLWRAFALVKLEDMDSALRDLQRALDLSDELYEELEHEPMLDALREDVRFRDVLHPPDAEE